MRVPKTVLPVSCNVSLTCILHCKCWKASPFWGNKSSYSHHCLSRWIWVIEIIYSKLIKKSICRDEYIGQCADSFWSNSMEFGVDSVLSSNLDELYKLWLFIDVMLLNQCQLYFMILILKAVIKYYWSMAFDLIVKGMAFWSSDIIMVKEFLKMQNQFFRWSLLQVTFFLLMLSL